MTIINNIEIDNINYKKNNIKYAILNNDVIEDKLNCIIVVSNPCQFASRYILAKEFIKRFEDEANVILYIVEMIYPKQKFILTNSKNKNHLQLKTNVPIWHKENMINIGVNKLLPKDWKAFAWIDADIEFENPHWALDTLKILNGTCDIVQLFSHCLDLNESNLINKVFSSFGFKYSKGDPYTTEGINYWHPGFAWACTRKAYEKMGGLFDLAILGSGDNIMAYSLINNGLRAINNDSTDDYKSEIIKFQDNIKNLTLGYVPGVIRHYFHGSKKNRKYTERWLILVNHLYSPSLHFKKDSKGILIPTNECPKEMLEEIYNYFKERNEDEFKETVV
jgi:hypothetical protein